MKIAFIGLGIMGYPMAGNLQKSGHDLCVFNRTAAKAQGWADQYQGDHAPTPRQAAEDAEIVFTCVGEDDDLRDVTLGEDGAFAGMKKDAVLVDHTTASADVARELDAIARQKGLCFMDAPVSGGQAGAEKGVLTIMCGGDSAVFNRVREACEANGRAVTLMGPVGSGQLTKMVNQICIVGLVQALSEGLNFAQKANLNTDRVLDVISRGAAGSWQMENRGQSMCKGEFDFGFAVDWARKDLKICLEEASRNGAPLPVTGLVDQFYAQVQAMGGKRWDTSSLIALLQRQ